MDPLQQHLGTIYGPWDIVHGQSIDQAAVYKQFLDFEAETIKTMYGPSESN